MTTAEEFARQAAGPAANIEPTGFLGECVRYASDRTGGTTAAGSYARVITA